MLGLYTWLREIQSLVSIHLPTNAYAASLRLPDQLVVILDAGRSQREQGNSVVKEALFTSVTFWETPWRQQLNSGQGQGQGGGGPRGGGGFNPPFLSALVATGTEVEQWIRSGSFRAFMASLFPFSATIGSELGHKAAPLSHGPYHPHTSSMERERERALGHPSAPPRPPPAPPSSHHQLPGSGRGMLGSLEDSIEGSEETRVASECQAQFDLVRSFEASHSLDLPSMPDAYIEQRSLLVSRILEVSEHQTLPLLLIPLLLFSFYNNHRKLIPSPSPSHL